MRRSLGFALAVVASVLFVAPAAFASPPSPCERKCQISYEACAAKVAKKERMCRVKADQWKAKAETKARGKAKGPSAFEAIAATHAAKVQKCGAAKITKRDKCIAKERKCADRCK